MSDQTLSNHNRLYSQREYLHASLASLKTASTQGFSLDEESLRKANLKEMITVHNSVLVFKMNHG